MKNLQRDALRKQLLAKHACPPAVFWVGQHTPETTLETFIQTCEDIGWLHWAIHRLGTTALQAEYDALCDEFRAALDACLLSDADSLFEYEGRRVVIRNTFLEKVKTLMIAHIDKEDTR